MKKFFTLLLALVCCVTVSAEVYKYRTSEIAFRYADDYGNWGNWGDWEDCNVLIVVGDNDRITIYSATTQVYDIIQYDGEENDDSGGYSLFYSAIDSDGDKCQIRIRKQADGLLQFYVTYGRSAWVYNMRSI